MRRWLADKVDSIIDKPSDPDQPQYSYNRPPPLPPATNRQFINGAYYPNWKIYKGQAPSSLNTACLSHIYYAFVWPNEDGSIAPSDDYADTKIEVDGVQGCMAALAKLKSERPHLKTILSIGGGGAGSSKFAGVAASADLRRTFAWNARSMIDQYGFDGIDIDWEHPQNHKEGLDYVALLAELRQALPSPYLLTTALPAGEWALKNIDLRAAAQHLDLINSMTYDFSGPWTPQVGHHAQLFAPKRPHNDAAKISGESAVQYLHAQGIPAYKIVLGIPAYGRSFLGSNGIGSSYSSHAGEEGTFEYKDLPRPGTHEHIDRETGAAYCIGGDGGFVTYDTVETVQVKAQFAKKYQLGGLFYWTATGDVAGPRSLIAAGYHGLHHQGRHLLVARSSERV